MPFHNYHQSRHFYGNGQKTEKCTICGGIEKSGFNYCRIRNFWRKMILFSFIFFMGALFFFIISNIKITAKDEFMIFLIAAGIFGAWFFPVILISIKIMDWDDKKIFEEEETLAVNPKQKVYPHYLKRIK